MPFQENGKLLDKFPDKVQVNSDMAEAYIGLGSNLGDSKKEIDLAMKCIGSLKGCQLVKSSSLYESIPEGGLSQPNYVNAVVKIRTVLSPQRLLAALFVIEHQRGRVRSHPNQSRSLDLDLLLYDDLEILEPGLTVPHPRMHTRAFVLIPLIEIESHLFIRGHGLICDLVRHIPKTGVKKLDECRI